MELNTKELAEIGKIGIGQQVKLRGKLWVKRENGKLEPVKSTPSSVPKKKNQQTLSSSTRYSPPRDRPSEQQQYEYTSGSLTDQPTGIFPSHLQQPGRPFHDDFQQSALEGRTIQPGEYQTGARGNNGQSGTRHDTMSAIAESAEQLSLGNTQLTSLGSDLPLLPNVTSDMIGITDNTQGGEYLGSASHRPHAQTLAGDAMTFSPPTNDPWEGLALARHVSNTDTSMSTTRPSITDVVSRSGQSTAPMARQPKPASMRNELKPERQDATSKSKEKQREENQLSGRCRELAKIPRQSLLQQADFIHKFPEAMKATGAQFYVEALKFARVNDIARMEDYLHYTVLLQRFKDKPEKAIYFLNKSAKDPKFEHMQQFREKYEKSITILMKDLLSEPSGETREADSNTTKFGVEIPQLPKSPTVSSTGNDTLVNSLARQRITVKQGADPKVVKDQLPKLDESYTFMNARKYFKRGVAFKIVWPEIYSSEKPKTNPSFKKNDRQPSKNVKDGIYQDQKTIYHVRRMIVVRNRDGYCSCVSINSYRGQGCTKPGLTNREVQAHAIAYDATKYPELVKTEPTLSKDPIAFDLIKGESLDQASRIHFSKLYSVDWNSPVAHIGVVAQSHMATLEEHFRQELMR